MKLISSRDNAWYKALKQLAGSAAARRKAGRTLLDGSHLCQVYLAQYGQPLHCVVNQDNQHHPEIATLMQACEAQTIVIPDAMYQAVSPVENGLGVLFVIDTPQPTSLPSLQQNAVLLDQVQDPGNLGSILRSAAAAGIRQVFCSPGTAAAWSPKVLRSGMGAHFLLQIYESVDLAELLRHSSIALLATSSYANQTLYDIDLKQQVAWLFGHEGQGVSPELLAQARWQIRIPHLGNMESLNVAACAAVCFFEQLRQNR
ncbi:MAG: hypothetical protein RL748_808 [Pseudomonadota bacterium]|jgi:TrmH family RNA methyltransferase